MVLAISFFLIPELKVFSTKFNLQLKYNIKLDTSFVLVRLIKS